MINTSNNNFIFNPTLSTNKRNRDKKFFNYQSYSPILTSGLIPFTPINPLESPSLQRYFNFNIEDRVFTQTPTGIFGYNRFNFSSNNNNNNNYLLKQDITPQERKNENF